MEPKFALPAPQIASTRRPALDSTAKPAPHHSKPVAPAIPKLDQFPSPQPLSDQERILASYVMNYPEQAALVARARAEILRQDREEERQRTASDSVR